MIKITKENYPIYLIIIDALITLDPDHGTIEGDFLKAIALKIQDYEKEHFYFDQPTPEELELFRIEESQSLGSECLFCLLQEHVEAL